MESSISFASSSNATSSELPCTSAAEVAESVAGGGGGHLESVEVSPDEYNLRNKTDDRRPHLLLILDPHRR